MADRDTPPTCFICGVHASQRVLVRHGAGSTSFWLCLEDEARAGECFDDRAAELLDAARMIEG